MTSHAILICDRDALFREALRNFLLAAGYHQIEIATTLREAQRICDASGIVALSLAFGDRPTINSGLSRSYNSANRTHEYCSL